MAADLRQQVTQLQSRHDEQRRKLERARRKRDKFVKVDKLIEHEPQPRPVRAKATPAPAPAPVIQFYDPNDKIIADELVHGDGLGDVLFEESEFYGEFSFRDSILEQLDRYWVYLRRMKKHDEDSYKMYRAIGATIVPYSAVGTNWEQRPLQKITPEELVEFRQDIKLTPWFIATRPAFGCIAVHTDPLSEQHEKAESHGKHWVMLPKFMYFVKYKKPPPEIQLISGGDIYKMTIWWDRPFSSDGGGKDAKYGIPTDVGVFISADGKHIQILRTLDTKMVRIYHTKGKRHNGLDYDLIPQRAWHIPDQYSKWAQKYGLDAQTHLAHLFCRMVWLFETSNLSVIKVNVYKEQLAATFGVNIKRLAYFFQDRDVQIDQYGVKKRIFHFVKGHRRRNGSYVKPYFCGLREFDWASYHVLITVPHRDHILIPEISLGMSDEYWMNKKHRHIYEGEFGEALAKNIHGTDLRVALAEVVGETAMQELDEEDDE